MNRKDTIHKLINSAADELLSFIIESESDYKDRWMPAAEIKNKLNLLFPAVPKNGTQYGAKGWLFASLVRILEDKSLLEYKKAGNRAFYRSR